MLPSLQPELTLEVCAKFVGFGVLARVSLLRLLSVPASQHHSATQQLQRCEAVCVGRLLGAKACSRRLVQLPRASTMACASAQPAVLLRFTEDTVGVNPGQIFGLWHVHAVLLVHCQATPMVAARPSCVFSASWWLLFTSQHNGSATASLSLLRLPANGFVKA